MAKRTLLELVQSILASVDGDEVNSITDTQEARQVASTLEDTYYDIVSRLDLPEHYSMFELEASGDNAKPTIMYLPSTCLKLLWVKYNNILSTETSPSYVEVKSLPFKEFTDRMYMLTTDDTNVETFSHTIGTDTIDFMYTNDAFPTYYTTPDDYMLIFDSYDSDEDTTLQKNKTVAYGQLSPTFTLEDSFTPDLDEGLFSLLLNEAKVVVHAEQRQQDHAVARQKARKHWIRSQIDKQAIKTGSALDYIPDYGRRRP